MIIWGGNGDSGGGRYSPTSNVWTLISSADAPRAREAHGAVWTGSDMIIWGGYGGTLPYFNDTFSYTPGRSLFLYQRP
jgi:hypothetical protein